MSFKAKSEVANGGEFNLHGSYHKYLVTHRLKRWRNCDGMMPILYGLYLKKLLLILKWQCETFEPVPVMVS